MSHPYQGPDHGSGDKNQTPDLDSIINSAVRFGTGVGSTVLGSIADALRLYTVDAESPKRETDFARWRRQVDRKLKNEKQGGALAAAIVGWVFCGCFGIAALVMAILAGVYSGYGSSVFVILAPIFSALTVGFGAMGWAGSLGVSYYDRLRKYLRAARDFVVPIKELARATTNKSATVKKDLQKAVISGYYPDACLDESGETLYLDGSLYQGPTQQADVDAPGQTPLEKFRLEGVDFLNYLRSCRGKLETTADEELAAMQKTCGAIVGFVNTHPEQLPRVRRFEEYYLPTTCKLLDTALGLGDVDAANAQSIRRDIAGILHTLNLAYGKLYDTLLQDMSMDVSTEIDTLETMLRQDGLTHDFESDFGKKTR